MPLFAAICFDHPPHAMALRDGVRANHRSYVLANAAPIRCAGAMRDAAGNQCGSIFVFDTASEADLHNWFQGEPFYCAGVYESIRNVLWSPAFNQLAACDWPAASQSSPLESPLVN